MKTCAVIPAAGTGTRLGSPIPKILLPITENETVLSIIYQKLFPIVDHIHIIVSPAGASLIGTHLAEAIKNNFVSINIQHEPKGMGDAIFRSYPFWAKAQNILVMWGDQVFVSEKTLKNIFTSHAGAERTVTLPLARMENPYVEYVFDKHSRLVNVHQSREGDICSPGGLSDVGTFMLSVPDLLSEWENYINKSIEGVETGEINFLPFLPFLDGQGWQVRITDVTDPTESRGINTAADLLFFQQLYSKKLNRVAT